MGLDGLLIKKNGCYSGGALDNIALTLDSSSLISLYLLYLLQPQYCVNVENSRPKVVLSFNLIIPNKMSNKGSKRGFIVKSTPVNDDASAI